MNRRRTVRRASLVALLILAFLGAFFLGFVVNEKRLPPYRQTAIFYEKLRPIYLRVRELFMPHTGRFRLARAAAPAGSALTDAQRAEIQALRSIGYVSGSTLAQGQSGVTIHDARRAYQGLNLQTDGHSPEAVLFDMEGRELHRWHLPFDTAFPDSDAPPWAEGSKYWRRVRLFENGDLLAIYEGNGLIKIDRDSRLLWAYPGWAHHDLHVLDDGTIYVLTRLAEMVPRLNEFRPVLHDFIVVLDPDGNELKRVSVLEAIERSNYAVGLLAKARDSGDFLHTNTLEVLDGSISERLPAFKAGNVLISILAIDTIAVVDMDEGKIAWALSGMFRQQHQPTVLENGNLLIFDNRGDNFWSRVIEFDPLTQEIVWSYDGSQHEFLSRTCGSSERLPNGNTLITETDNGRAFEVTPVHEIVWEYWTPNRTGKSNEYIATLFEVSRLEPDFGFDWLGREVKHNLDTSNAPL